MENSSTKKKPYGKMAVMLLISFIIMYAVMFLNVFHLDDIFLSLTRMYMTLLMIAPMAVLMLLFMWKMYPDKKINYSIITVSILVFIGSLTMLRNQNFVSDVQYIKAMIPHHSSAILTSTNANLKDSEVQKLSKEIIEAQEKEIKQMNAMLKRLENEN